MSFILVLKDDQGAVTLLSEESYDSRKQALAALTGITAESTFGRWDDEVLVVDLNSATPVLLVRPAAAPVVEEEVAAVEPEEAAVEEPLETEPDAESESDVTDEEPAEEPEEPVEAEEDSESIVTEADIVDESADETVPDEVEAEPEVGEGGSLRDALARTAAQMEADGISAPESVGPAESDYVIHDDEAAESETPAGDAILEEILSEAETEAEAEAEPEAEAEAEAETAAQAAPDDEAVAETADAAEAASADESWPWAVADEPADAEATGAVTETTPSAPETEFSLDALEEPGTDEGSLVRAAGDDETMASARPVILGDYDAPAVEPMGVREGDTEAVPDDDLAESIADALIDVVQPLPETGTESTDAEVSHAGTVSDFILDMPAPAAVEEASTVPSDETVADSPTEVADEEAQTLSCSECVYVNTCPNKGERDPATCGSFQWK